MKKALLCCRQESMVVAQAIGQVVKLIDVEIEICTHEDAIATFFSGEYSHVIVLDYSERENKSSGGFATYRDIEASALPDQKMIRAGYEKLSHSDYWQLPGELVKLFHLLMEDDTGS